MNSIRRDTVLGRVVEMIAQPHRITLSILSQRFNTWRLGNLRDNQGTVPSAMSLIMSGKGKGG